ncbi:hypothetical protein EPUL_003835 [Erysiphe pulchra]|uniref:Uncharacterized protein n=1 Tax=Erysiphe pulchra TaxID=225359 RepID=A0A2S4PMQ9_9PEZI|nr:hypothetical protein EPUL_003835 [Erysiphe pulchra]
MGERLKAKTQKNPVQVITISIHPFPKKLQIKRDSWIKVARISYKKSRASKRSVEPKGSNARAQGLVKRLSFSIDRDQSSQDKRLFIRLSQDHKLRNLSPADSRKFLARPTRLGMPIKEQLKTYRSAGDWEYQVVTIAKVEEAEAKSAASTIDTFEETGNIMNFSLSREYNFPCNSQALFVEDR